MEWFIAIVVGLAVGWLAWGLFAADKGEGLLAHLVAGLIGGLAGKWILSSVWVVGSFIVGANFNLYSVLWAALGAGLAVGIWRLITVSTEVPTSLPR